MFALPFRGEISLVSDDFATALVSHKHEHRVSVKVVFSVTLDGVFEEL